MTLPTATRMIPSDHADFPHFSNWYDLSTYFWDLAGEISGIESYDMKSPAFADWSLLDTKGDASHVDDLIAEAEMVVLNASMHMAAIGGLARNGNTFLNLPTYSLARVVMEAGAKLVYVMDGNLTLNDRLSRFYSIHHEEMRLIHLIGGKQSDWKNASSLINMRAATCGATVKNPPPMVDLVDRIQPNYSTVYRILCGPTHSDSSKVRQLAMKHVGQKRGTAWLEENLNPRVVTQVLWMTFQAFATGYKDYITYTGNENKALGVNAVLLRFRDYTKNLPQ